MNNVIILILNIIKDRYKEESVHMSARFLLGINPNKMRVFVYEPEWFV